MRSDVNKQERTHEGLSRRLPIYFLVDCSRSMDGEPRSALFEAFESFIQELLTEPQCIETVWIGIIAFATDAWQLVRLSELSSVKAIFPVIDARDESALGAAFFVLNCAIDREVVPISAIQPGDFRPLVIVLIDGPPVDDWKPQLTELINRQEPKLAGMLFMGLGPDVCVDSLIEGFPEIVGIDMANPRTDLVRRFFKWVDQIQS